ncbi:hypothetical protein RclHR1_03660015 [Rhizophagus clarus]|nr:hypothetical protein RclHR1_03660015 [Rhizophagus clarus]
MKSIMLPARYHSTNTGDSANQPIIPDLSMKFEEILRSIKLYNNSLQNLESLSETVKENLNKFAVANSSTRALNNSIKDEIDSTIKKLADGETKRVKIKNDICSKLKEKSETILYS